jgi:hypothetical protein
MDQQTKDFLRKKGIDKQFFPSIETLQLHSHTLLEGITYRELAETMTRGQARYIYDKLHTHQPFPKNIRMFLNECGISEKYHVY